MLAKGSFSHCFTGTEPRYAIPDGCVDMVFCCDPNHPYAEICGTVLSPQVVLSECNTTYFGVRFLPGYNPVLGSADIMAHLVNHRIPLDDLIQDRRMLEGIWGASDFRQQIRVFMRSYMNIYRRVCPQEHQNLLVLHSSNLMIRSGGGISVIRPDTLTSVFGMRPDSAPNSWRRSSGFKRQCLR